MNFLSQKYLNLMKKIILTHKMHLNKKLQIIQVRDEYKEEFGIYKNQEVPPLLLTTIEDVNELAYTVGLIQP